MLKATAYMFDHVSTEGGFVWYYTPDLSRRWGEMEAYKSMIWMQDGGTVQVGHMLLDVYHATGNEFFYEHAEKVAAAIIKGQSKAGGWNYMVDFAGEKSMKKWYATIGKNAWRLEEFQHYYGNDTYDDDVTSNTSRFLLRMYIEKHDAKYKPALDKAISFILKSQYPNGGWPQRYPLKYDFQKKGHPDYSSFHTFNDDVIGENLNFLIQCYQHLGDKRFLEPIKKAMNFYCLSQKPNGAWGQQYDMNLNVEGARTYEPAAYLPRTTFGNAMLMLRFYQYTGDKKFLAHIPDAINWLERVRLSEGDAKSKERFTHPLYVEVGTDKPVYVHRKGSNAVYGYYYTDTSDEKLLAHMYGKSMVNIEMLKTEYERVKNLTPEEATKDSPLKKREAFDKEVLQYINYGIREREMIFSVNESMAKSIINALDAQNRWLVKHAMISHPYIGDGQKKEPTDEFATTNVGDETDTSPYRDMSDQLYISTPAYIQNMYLLMRYIQSAKNQH
ncbi:MAG: pectate lyase [Lacibacter sp.]